MVMGMGASKMNTTNIAIGIGIVGILYYKFRMTPATPKGFVGIGNDGPINYQNWCGTGTPTYGNDKEGTYTEIEPVETPTQPRSVWTKDEGSWLWGWGPKK